MVDVDDEQTWITGQKQGMRSFTHHGGASPSCFHGDGEGRHHGRGHRD